MSERRYFNGDGGEWCVSVERADDMVRRVEAKFGPQSEITHDEYRRLRRNRLARERRAKRVGAP